MSHSPEEPAPTLLERLGGAHVVHRLETAFYDMALADPVLADVFPVRQPTHVDHLTAFTVESFGGEPRFTEELGFRYLIDRHRGLRITDEQRRRFVQLYVDAFDTTVPDAAPEVRAAVVEHVEFGSHVAQQNSHARTDAELHPLREVPRWVVAPGLHG